MSEPKVRATTYVFTWLGLLGLTLLTSVLGRMDLGNMSMIVGLLIASLKALLIVCFFMHALYDSRLVRMAIAGGVAWLFIMMTLTLTDYMTRGWLPFPGK